MVTTLTGPTFLEAESFQEGESGHYWANVVSHHSWTFQ